MENKIIAVTDSMAPSKNNTYKVVQKKAT